MRRLILAIVVLIPSFILILRSEPDVQQSAQSAMDSIAYVDGVRYKTIEAADKALGSMPGEIWVSRASESTVSGPLDIGALHTVKFIQGGVYLVSGTITLNQGSCLVGEPGGEGDGSNQSSVVLKMANGANLSPMIRYAGSQACIVDLVLDGNKMRNPTAGPVLLVNAGIRTSTVYSTIQNSKGDGVDLISTGTNNQAAAAQFDRVMFLDNDLDGLYCANTGDVWATNRTQFENNGLGGGAFAESYTKVNTSDRSVTWASGAKWTIDRSIIGRDVSINKVHYSISSVVSTTELEIDRSAGRQTNAAFQMGHGVELSGCYGVRIEDSDFGGSELDGLKISGYRGIAAAGIIVTGNQFGNNLEYDTEIEGWDSWANRFGAFGEHIVDNYFIGRPRESPSSWSGVYIQDSRDNEIATNSFLPFTSQSYRYGIEIRETVPGREGRDSVVGNSFSGEFGKGSFVSNAAKLTGFEGNKEAGLPNSLLSQPYIANGDLFQSSDANGTLAPLFTLRNDIHFIYGHPTKKEIDLQPNPNTTRLQVLDGGVNIVDVPLSAPSLTVGTDGTPLRRYARYSAIESPSPIKPNNCGAQKFSNVNGILAEDILIAVSKTKEQPGLSVTPGHVEGNDSLTVNFCNSLSTPLRPTAKEAYEFIVVQ